MYLLTGAAREMLRGKLLNVMSHGGGPAGISAAGLRQHLSHPRWCSVSVSPPSVTRALHHVHSCIRSRSSTSAPTILTRVLYSLFSAHEQGSGALLAACTVILHLITLAGESSSWMNSLRLSALLRNSTILSNHWELMYRLDSTMCTRVSEYSRLSL